ncbi:MAG: GHKL domain-containing protein [Bdellovibrio sp.]|nr:GHKL domain-containing protein [Bdellovibrio sp.]
MAFGLFSRNYKFLNIYMAVSSLAIILIGLFELAFSQRYGQVYLQPHHLPWCFLVVGQLYLWKMQLDCETLNYDLGWASSLFLFQGSGLICLFAATLNPSYLTFLSFPVVAANLFFTETAGMGVQESSKKALSFLGILILLIGGVFRLNSIAFLPTYMLSFIFILASFLLSWSASWAGRIEQRTLIHSIFRRLKRDNAQQMRDPSERLFYHDLINHLHGMGLFLESYSHKPNDLTDIHVRNLLQELQMTQRMVEDFFAWPHKNKINVKSGLTVTLCDLRPLMDHYLDIYCRSQGMEVTVEWKGDLAQSRPESKQRECTVHGHAFVRIMTNILKNIFEGHSSKVCLTFEGEARQLFVLIKNTKFHTSHDLRDGKELANLILKNAAEPGGLGQDDGHGLDSIDELCQTLGGQFKFYLEDGWWHTRIHLPYFHDSLVSEKEIDRVNSFEAPKKTAA